MHPIFLLQQLLFLTKLDIIFINIKINIDKNKEEKMINIILSFPIWLNWILCIAGLWLLNLPDSFYSITMEKGGISLVLIIMISIFGLFLFALPASILITHYVSLFMPS